MWINHVVEIIGWKTVSITTGPQNWKPWSKVTAVGGRQSWGEQCCLQEEVMLVVEERGSGRLKPTLEVAGSDSHCDSWGAGSMQADGWGLQRGLVGFVSSQVPSVWLEVLCHLPSCSLTLSLLLFLPCFLSLNFKCFIVNHSCTRLSESSNLFAGLSWSHSLPTP